MHARSVLALTLLTGLMMPPMALAADAARPAVAAGGHKLQRTFMVSGVGGYPLGLEEWPVGEVVSVNCNSAAGCTLVAEGMAQLSLPSGTAWYLCAKVDGVPMGSCPMQIRTSSAGYWAVGSWRGRLSVAEGPHAVQAVIFNDKSGGVLGEYQMDIHLYKP